MKTKTLLQVLAFCFLTGCGNFKISPRGCNGSGYYGHENAQYEKSVVKKYYTFLTDREVRLTDIIDCSNLETIKISIKKSMLYKYTVTVNYTNVEEAKE